MSLNRGEAANSEETEKMDTSDLKSLNIWQLFEQTAGLWPEREALVFENRRLSYQKVRELAERCAAGLAWHGLTRGDRLALIMPNWTEFIITFLAAARLGAVIVPLNTRYRRPELEYMLKDSGAKIIVSCASFGGFDYIELLKEIRPVLPALEHIVVVGQAAGGQGLITWESVLHEAASATLPPLLLDPQEDLFTLLYTGSPTGKPEGLHLTHAELITSGLRTVAGLSLNEQDRYIVAVPLFHIFALSDCVMTAYSSGGCLVLLDIFSAEAALTLVQSEQITIHNGVPAMFIQELAFPNFSRFDLASLRTGIIAATSAPSELVRQVREEMNCNIVPLNKWEHFDLVELE